MSRHASVICGCEHYVSEKSIKLISCDEGDGRMNVYFVLSGKNDSVSSGSSLSPYLNLSVMPGLFQGFPQENGYTVAAAPASTPVMGPFSCILQEEGGGVMGGGQSQKLGKVPPE